MSDRILPKSLHTITVLVNLAAHIRAGRFVETTAVEDVRYALRILGLSDLTDAHGLFAAAVKRVEEARRPAETLGNGPRLDRACLPAGDAWRG